MAIVEIRSSVSFKSLMHRSRSDLARNVLELHDRLDRATKRAAELEAILNTPVLQPFADAVVSEAKHQVFRWGTEHDVTKTAWDWFWTLGYLGGKAAHAALARDFDKALHHTVTAGALLANWHRHITAAKTAAEVPE